MSDFEMNDNDLDSLSDKSREIQKDGIKNFFRKKNAETEKVYTFDEVIAYCIGDIDRALRPRTQTKNKEVGWGLSREEVAECLIQAIREVREKHGKEMKKLTISPEDLRLAIDRARYHIEKGDMVGGKPRGGKPLGSRAGAKNQNPMERDDSSEEDQPDER